MIYALYTLMKKYRNKKIFIWNVNRDSMGIFLNASFAGIDIQGFVTSESQYAGEIYMNRPIITPEQFKEDKENIILASDDVSKDVMDMFPDERMLYWPDSLNIHDGLKEKEIIVYGTGKGAELLDEALAKEEMEASLYCVTKKEGNARFKGKEVIEASDLDKYADYAVIVSVMTLQAKEEILEALSVFHGQIYVDLKNMIHDTSEINFVQSLDYAVKKKREIYLYSRRNAFAKLIEETLKIYDIKISGYVYDAEDRSQNIENIYALSWEGTENKLIIINEYRAERMIAARNNIEYAGFLLENANYTSLRRYTPDAQKLAGNLQYICDPLTGVSVSYSKDRTGWMLYGREEEGSVRILVLGGSTSSEEYHPENWIGKLYNKLKRKNIKAVIFNGACPGDDIVDEILRLLRDGYALRPHIIISMSGVNNLRYKEGVNQFNEGRLIEWAKVLSPDGNFYSGIQSNETLYSFWNRNQKLLKVISEFYGASFFGFLQPMNITEYPMTLREKSLYEQEGHIKGVKEFAGFVNNEDDYVIADKVWEVIKPVIQNLVKKGVSESI